MKQGLILGLYMGWLWLLYINGPLLHNFTAAWGMPAGQIFLGFVLCHALALHIISRCDYRTCTTFNKQALLYIAGGAATIGSIFPAVIHLLPHFAIPVITFSVIAASGGSALLLTACGVSFSHLPVRNAAIAFAVAVIFGTLLFYGLNLMSPAITVLIVAFIPVIVANRLVQKQATTKITAASPKNPACQLPLRLKILLAIIYTTGGLMHKSIVFYSPSPIVESYWLTNIIYCLVCIICGAIIYLFPNIDLRLLYRPVVPLLAAGFILFPLLAAKSNIIVAFFFLQTGFALFDLYTWLLFVYLANFYSYPQRIIAQGMFYITFFIFIGEFLFTSPIVVLIESRLSTIMSSAAIILLLTTLVFRDERESFSGWKPVSESDTFPADALAAHSKEAPTYSTKIDSSVIRQQSLPVSDNDEIFESEFRHFAAEKRLTPREEEILLLLAKGRNNPFIVEQLNISANTLKTHLRNLYRKCGVADRQELLSLLEEYRKLAIIP